MSKVYVVTAGDYSDYRICYICSTEEKANQAVRHWDKNSEYESSCIEEWELDAIDEVKNLVAQGYAVYSTNMLYDTGDGARATKWDITGVRMTKFYRRTPEGGPPYWTGDVWAKSPEHAIKIANEKRVQHKAEPPMSKDLTK